MRTRRAEARRGPSAVLAVALSASLAAALAAAPAAAQSRAALQGLRRVAIEITMAPDHPLLDPAALEQRLEELVLASPGAPRLDPQSADRIRLTVSVRQYTGSDLRGFYLPFSGVYGIGGVRLSVERQASIAGLAAPIPVVVWQEERTARAAWHRSAAEIMGLVEELVGALAESLGGGRQ
jgi:hypothetical protein